MDPSKDSIKLINEYIDIVLTKGMEIAGENYPEIAVGNNSDDTFILNFKSYIDKVQQAYDYIKELSNGNLSVCIGQFNYIAMPLKALQANLKHLIWQTEQIKNGDLNQKVDFLGDFSNSFNSLVDESGWVYSPTLWVVSK